MFSASKAFRIFFHGYSSLSASVSKLSLAVSMLILGVLVAVTLLAVFYRYLLISPIQWAEEVARYLLIWMTLLGASVTIRERQQIRLDSLVRRLPFKLQLGIEVSLFLVVVFLMSVVLFLSVEMLIARSSRILSPSLQVAMTWAHLALPVGFGLILFQSVYVLVHDLNRLLGRQENNGAEERSEPSY